MLCFFDQVKSDSVLKRRTGIPDVLRCSLESAVPVAVDSLVMVVIVVHDICETSIPCYQVSPLPRLLRARKVLAPFQAAALVSLVSLIRSRRVF